MEDVLRSFGPGVTSGNERGEVGQSRLGEQPAAMHRGVSSGDVERLLSKPRGGWRLNDARFCVCL